MAKIFNIHPKRHGSVNKALKPITSVSVATGPVSPPQPPPSNNGRLSRLLQNAVLSMTAYLLPLPKSANLSAHLGTVISSSSATTSGTPPANSGHLAATMARLTSSAHGSLVTLAVRTGSLVASLGRLVSTSSGTLTSGGTPAVNTVSPSISGTRGGTLTRVAGTWTGSTSVTGQWYLDGTATGNTSATLNDTDTSLNVEYRETAQPGSVVASGWKAIVANASSIALNPADLTGGLTLSGGNLIATGTGGLGATRSNTQSTGKGYIEVRCNNINGVVCIGISDLVGALNNWPGVSDNHGASCRSDGCLFYSAFEYDNAFPTFTNGSVIQIAYDFPNKRVWFGKDGIFQGNPSAGTGSLPISSGTGGFYLHLLYNYA